ncbi:hypothetical protein IMG5_192670 [Ichthyophthirius multifiliis]|uniref:phosphopyruvate hydratase n=1 Tax=Ichthyophthirius multifiliis TaxID=5932 RepID=G0R4H0_ICHMU|nr:hypothetical protein IMG5_192670 [Ichthyophthirius multifiliis]EGR27635.1 hypothetical protein IMG5_192670 [Ichthyophthirius multifiliis]|eukprot:XP_004025087.1 hypothetical protein IMG5_192670 [Ichthyophthirius multifiliis]
MNILKLIKSQSNKNYFRSFSSIKSIHAREILDSRGNPTVECEVTTSNGIFTAAVPSGASTGIYEAVEIRDNVSFRYGGKGVQQAVNAVNITIADALKGESVTEQQKIDEIMVKRLDGTFNKHGWTKSHLGANAILSVSLAVARAGAAAKGIPLYQYLGNLAEKKQQKFIMPVPSLNVINGGKHAGNKLAMQEFMILPIGANSFKEGLQMGAEVYHALKSVIKKKYGLDATNVGDEGGFAPNIQETRDGLNLLVEAIQKSGHEGKIVLGMDVAASEFWNEKQKLYDLDFKNKSNDGSHRISGQQLTKLYEEICKDYPIKSIEDPFDQDDWIAYQNMNESLGQQVQIVGDDLLVTNPMKVQNAIDKLACNALLLKVNQIGTVTESIQAARLAQDNNFGVMVSHRSGETEDTFIADLSVGLACGQIKTGAPCRSERLAKYNQLLRIEEQLGSKAVYAGQYFRYPSNLL